MSNLNIYLNKLSEGSELSEQDMVEAMQIIMSGDASEDQIEQFLVFLADRGETIAEITGAAKVMRDKASSIQAPDNAVDCCGTGGDASGTYNISTAVALVSAACGVPIAKHGNRAASSKSGAADVLEALGVNLDVSLEQLEQALEQFNFCFLMAPHHHKAMKYVVPVRKKLGRRTIFNVLGPLANPAGTQYQLIGVFDKALVRPMAEVLKNLGTKRAWVVHGSDGLDEITTTAETHVAILDNGTIEEKTLSPDDFGLPTAKPEDLLGGEADENANAIRALLNGEPSAYRYIVCANTAAVLTIAGKVKTLKDGVEAAQQAIDSKKAKKVLEGYAAFTHGITA
ncbi:MAG: anthranilate phosphoribosyltransferase [Pseudomonadota bacterium]